AQLVGHALLFERGEHLADEGRGGDAVDDESHGFLQCAQRARRNDERDTRERTAAGTLRVAPLGAPRGPFLLQPPPRTRTICPVTRAASADTRKRTTRATSSGRLRRPDFASSSRTPGVIHPVSVGPGSTALIVTPRAASHGARLVVSASRPP